MKINTINIVEVSRHGGVERLVSYDANYPNTAESDFEQMARKEYPDYHDDMISAIMDNGYFDTKTGNTVCLVKSKV